MGHSSEQGWVLSSALAQGALPRCAELLCLTQLCTHSKGTSVQRIHSFYKYYLLLMPMKCRRLVSVCRGTLRPPALMFGKAENPSQLSLTLSPVLTLPDLGWRKSSGSSLGCHCCLSCFLMTVTAFWGVPKITAIHPLKSSILLCFQWNCLLNSQC